MVPLTGLEPVWYFYRGILSPLCLPISPQRHYNINYFTTKNEICQVPKRNKDTNSGKNTLPAVTITLKCA